MIRILAILILLLPSLALADIAAVKALNPTAWWRGYYGHTLHSSTLSVNTLADFSGNSRTFSQGTGGLRAWPTRQDNRENRVKYSETYDISLGYWSNARSTTVLNQAVHPLTGLTTVALLREDATAANTHELRLENNYLIAGSTYVYRVIAKAAGRTMIRLARAGTSGFSANFNLSTGIATINTGTPVLTMTDLTGGWYLCEMQFTPTISENTQLHIYLMSGGVTAYNGDNTSGAYITDVQLRDTSADSVYIKTDLAPFFRGVSGIPALHFDGVDDTYTSTATLDDLFSSINKAWFIVFRTTSASTTQVLMRGNAGNINAYITGGNLVVYNNDGAADTITAPIVANTTYIAEIRHTGGYLNLRLNGGSWVTPVASGTTGTLTDTLVLGSNGAGGQYFTGDLVEMLTFDTAFSDANMQTVYDYLSGQLTQPRLHSVQITP